MQTAVAQKSAMRSAVAVRPSRAAVVVRAESRRAVLGGFLAGAAALSVANQAQAITPVDLFDDRSARERGFDIIYEARDLDLPQNQRDGLTQARGDLASTKKRVSESEQRIDSAIEPFINKAYWTEAREELRRQVGTLRFDLGTLSVAKSGSKEDRKKAIALSKNFIAKVEDLDYSLRKKDQASATAKLAKVKSSLDEVLAFVL